VPETRKKVRWKTHTRKSRKRVWKSKWVTVRSQEKSGK
jgi:hypothetical protein